MPRSSQAVVVCMGDRAWNASMSAVIAPWVTKARIVERPRAVLTAARDASAVLVGLTDERQLELVKQVAGLGPNRPALVAVSTEGHPLLARGFDAGADDCLVIPAGHSETITRIEIATRRRLLEAEQTMLRRISMSVAASHDRVQLCDQVAREVAQLLRADGGRVVQYTGDGAASVLGAWRGPGLAPVAPGAQLELAPSWALAKVQREGRAARSALTPQDARRAEAPLRVSLAAPIRVAGALWGAVAVAFMDPARAHENALAQIERAAELLSMAVANAEARERLADLATTDPLTGLLNHGAFHQRLVEEIERAACSSNPLSLALLDLDHFKQVNDRFGHRAGDDALRAVADLVQGHARAVDAVGRVGGEELAWLMPDADVSGAQSAAERLRAAIAAATIPAVASVTASIGVAQLYAGQSGASLFDDADGALYAAKGAGRNRVEASTAAPCA